MVAALGAGGMLVGVSHECDFPPEVRALPRVTRTRVDPAEPSGMIDRAMAAAKQAGLSPVEIDLQLVAHLRPHVLLLQAPRPARGWGWRGCCVTWWSGGSAAWTSPAPGRRGAPPGPMLRRRGSAVAWP